MWAESKSNVCRHASARKTVIGSTALLAGDAPLAELCRRLGTGPDAGANGKSSAILTELEGLARQRSE